MSTVAATAVSLLKNTREAAGTAAREAVARLAGAKATYGFAFVSPNHDLAAALDAVRSVCPDVPIVGCTTAGEITEAGLVHGGVALMLVSANATVSVAFASGMKADPKRASEALVAGLPEVKKTAAHADRRHLTTVLLTDGLAATGERLVDALYEGRPQSGARLVGGAAGDEGAFRATRVGTGSNATTDAAAALHIFGLSPWGVGVDHGLRPASKPMRVTRAHDNVVAEIDGEPAFAAYKRHAAARGVDLTPESAGPYLIANELGVHFFDKVSRARAPLSVGTDGSLTCAGDIPRGAMVSILDGEPSRMIDAARTASERARDQLQGRQAAGVLLFDCVCRGMILKDQFDREVSAVRSVFPRTPIAGFLTYGEIARTSEILEGWHNTTAVVVAIPSE
jgi:methyl-accepting chemotaxis protein